MISRINNLANRNPVAAYAVGLLLGLVIGDLLW